MRMDFVAVIEIGIILVGVIGLIHGLLWSQRRRGGERKS